MKAPADDNSLGRSINGADHVSRRRQMAPAELLGQHTHQTADGKNIQIWQRDGKYLARGYVGRQRFGETLGADPREAVTRLRRLIVEIEDGSYVRPSEKRKRPLNRDATPRLTVRQLCDEFLLEKRRLRGATTASTYQSRLNPVIEFAERPASRKKWPLAQDADREFAVELKNFLHLRKVSRNGRASSPEKPMSASQIRNVLDCARTMFAWATKPAINKLPAYLANPIDQEIVGPKPQKDPLREILLSIEERIKLVSQMDAWQLTHFAIPMVLPLRPEDYAGLLISEVDFQACEFRFGTRFGGRDFNKCGVSFVSPFPHEIVPLLRICVGGRVDGPLLRKRTVFDGRRRPTRSVQSTDDIANQIDSAFAQASPGTILAPQDHKALVRRTLREMGGVSEGSLAKEFKALLKLGGVSKGVRMYDLRGSINTELNRAGVSHLDQRYLTGHGTKDILNEYVALDPRGEMPKYFRTIKPLLNATQQRAIELGLPVAFDGIAESTI